MNIGVRVAIGVTIAGSAFLLGRGLPSDSDIAGEAQSAAVVHTAYDRCSDDASDLGVSTDVCEALSDNPTVDVWDNRNLRDGWSQVGSTHCFAWADSAYSPVVTVCADGKVSTS